MKSTNLPETAYNDKAVETNNIKLTILSETTNIKSTILTHIINNESTIISGNAIIQTTTLFNSTNSEPDKLKIYLYGYDNYSYKENSVNILYLLYEI